MDICKFKSQDNSKWCRVIWGYCQFLENGFQDGHICPIKAVYSDFYNYLQEAAERRSTDGVTSSTGLIATQKAFNELFGETADIPADPDVVIVDTLDLTI